MNFITLSYITLFLGYFVIHSILASLWFKQLIYIKWPETKLYYRLLFNIISLVLFIPLVFLLFYYPGEQLWQWLGWESVFFNGLAIIAMLGFYLSLADYNLDEFFGINLSSFSLSSFSVYLESTKQQFCIGRFHQIIRHPWYFFLLILIWTRDMTSYQFLTAILLTAYIIVGSYLEEKKLISYFGDIYRQYQQKVPALIPLPWKYLTRKEADQLINNL